MAFFHFLDYFLKISYKRLGGLLKNVLLWRLQGRLKFIMVKQTFKNLSMERQREILSVAYEEFALKRYQNVSLSEIIKRLGLAKGSFYRYFSGKKDLYAYLLQEGTKIRYKNLSTILKQSDIDIFDIIRLNLQAIIQSDKENPLISGFIYQVMQEREYCEVSELIEKEFSDAMVRTREVLSLPHIRNKLNISDVDFVAFHVFHFQLKFYDFVVMKYRIDYVENIRNHVPVLNIPDTELNKIIDWSVDFLKNGLIKRDNDEQD